MLLTEIKTVSLSEKKSNEMCSSVCDFYLDLLFPLQVVFLWIPIIYICIWENNQKCSKKYMQNVSFKDRKSKAVTKL